MPGPCNSRQHPAEAPGLRTDTLADSVLILLSLMGVQRLIGFARAILFCRWLDTEELGQWDMAFGFLMLAAPAGVLALSSCFRRYVAYYLQRGQLRMLIRRTAVIQVVFAAMSVGVICLLRDPFSRLIFGTPDDTGIIPWIAVSLLGVIGFHYFLDLLAALRNIRWNAGIQLVNSLAFAALGIGLLLGWQCDARSVVVAYGGSCAVAAACGTWWVGRIWSRLPESTEPAPLGGLLARIVPFSFSIWVASLLTNASIIVDRYMIIHCAGLGPDDALAQVGNYHSARLVPLLLVSVLDLLGMVLMPYLSSDWEAGRRDRVGARLNLMLKLSSLGMSAGAAIVLLAAPLLFGVILGGKFAAGLAVLPWTLTYCAWFGIMSVAEGYVLCAERAGLVTLARAACLLASIALNLVLLPYLGLLGAVMAAAAANLVSLALVLGFSRRLGFRMHRGTLLLLALPLAYPLGATTTCAVLAIVSLVAWKSDRLFSSEEKQRLIRRLAAYWETLQIAVTAARPGRMKYSCVEGMRDKG